MVKAKFPGNLFKEVNFVVLGDFNEGSSSPTLVPVLKELGTGMLCQGLILSNDGCTGGKRKFRFSIRLHTPKSQAIQEYPSKTVH